MIRSISQVISWVISRPPSLPASQQGQNRNDLSGKQPQLKWFSLSHCLILLSPVSPAGPHTAAPEFEMTKLSKSFAPKRRRAVLAWRTPAAHRRGSLFSVEQPKMGKGGKGEARKLLCVRVAIASHARRTHAHRAASTYYVRITLLFRHRCSVLTIQRHGPRSATATHARCMLLRYIRQACQPGSASGDGGAHHARGALLLSLRDSAVADAALDGLRLRHRKDGVGTPLAQRQRESRSARHH